MDNSETRLTKIFEAVFPDLPVNRIPAASQDSIQAWDSVAAITLMNLIDEEFGIQMEFDDLGELTA
ncbi:MAG TPA: acyl carrier protein, partial [Chthoniobacterales bacterium]|nr:acyl carrier protein [Chthoniobacterales bacterium]